MTEGLITPLKTDSNHEFNGWGLNLSPKICPECKAALLSPNTGAEYCPLCHSATLELHSDAHSQAIPELLLETKLQTESIRNNLNAWSAGIWLRPPDFTPETLASRLQPCFFPMWLVDGTTRGKWKAQVGYDYQVLSSSEAYTHGSWSSQQQAEVRIRWEPRLGMLERRYLNLSAPALEEHQRLMNELGGYPVREAIAFQPSYIEGAHVRLPNLDTEKAWPLARTQFERAVAQDCQQAAGGQHIDQIQTELAYSDLNWTLLLFPVYSTYYRDDEGIIRNVLINGRSGQVFGVRRASQTKGWRWTGTVLGVGLACILLAAILSIGFGLIAPFAALSTILFILGLISILVSPIGAIWAWQYNRSSPRVST